MNPFAQMMRGALNGQLQQGMNMNQDQMRNMLQNISDQQLLQFAQQARSMGMNESVINQGMQFVQGLRK